jgi:hypothetical protein
LHVDLIDGNRGEFTVLVDGKVVAQKGTNLPTVEDVVHAVETASPVEAGTRS